MHSDASLFTKYDKIATFVENLMLLEAFYSFGLFFITQRKFNMRYFILICLVGILGIACNSKSTSDTTNAAPQREEVQKVPVTKKATQATPSTTSAVSWMNFEEAQKKSANDSKLMIVDVYTHWCGPCKMMDRMTFNDPEVAKIVNEKFHPVKFNAESPDEVTIANQVFNNPGYRADIPKNRRNAPHQLVRKLGVRGYPTLVVLDNDLNIKANIVGFKKPEQLLQELAKL